MSPANQALAEAGEADPVQKLRRPGGKGSRARIVKLDWEDFERGKDHCAPCESEMKRQEADIPATLDFPAGKAGSLCVVGFSGVDDSPQTGHAANDETIPNKVIPKKPLGYRIVKRTFDIVFSLCVIVVGLVPGLILSVFVARDTGGSPIYSSVRVGWSIIGQKSGAASAYALRPALSALEANSDSGTPCAYEGCPVIPFVRISSNVSAFSQVKKYTRAPLGTSGRGVAA